MPSAPPTIATTIEGATGGAALESSAPLTHARPMPGDDGEVPTVAERLEGRKAARDLMLRPWMVEFVDALERVPILSVVCRSERISGETLAKWRAKVPAFDEAIRLTIGEAADQVEGSLYAAAKAGDVRAMEIFLRAHRPEKYREPKAGGGAVTVNVHPVVSAALARMFGRDPVALEAEEADPPRLEGGES